MSYLLGQGLWHYKTGLTRPHVPVGEIVEVKVAFSGVPLIDSRFLLSLWAMLAYGGIGARTRRGFGRLRCTKVTGALPAGWTPADLCTHDWTSLTSDPLPARLRGMAGEGWPAYVVDGTDDAFPAMPTLASRWWGGALLDYSGASFDRALGPAGQAWRSFRLGKHPDDEPHRDDKSPEWLHAIHGGDDRYPIAAFGLPVNYYSSTTHTAVDVAPTSSAGETIRRASPVWLVPVRLPSGQWDVFTHVFYARLLPAGTTLAASRGIIRNLRIPSEKTIEEAWDNWLAWDVRISPDFYANQ
jgi:CRISPR-associated protein Cmr1